MEDEAEATEGVWRGGGERKCGIELSLDMSNCPVSSDVSHSGGEFKSRVSLGAWNGSDLSVRPVCKSEKQRK